MSRLIVMALLLAALPIQAEPVRDRTPDEIDAFMTRLVNVDKQCRIKLGSVNPAFGDGWVLSCGLGDSIFGDGFEIRGAE